MPVIRQIYINEIDGVFINVDDIMPFPIPLIFGIGKNPVVQILKRNDDGTRTLLPNIAPSFEYNDEKFVTKVWINAEDDGGLAVNNMVVNIYPQQYLNV